MKRILLCGILILVATRPALAYKNENSDCAAEQPSLTSSQTTVPAQPTPSRAQIILEQYEALRTEIILCLESRLSIVSFGFAAVGALLAGGIAAMTRERAQHLAASLIIGVILTLTSVYVLNMWILESERLERASHFNYCLEKDLSDLYPGGAAPLAWEHQIRTSVEPYRSLLVSDTETPLIFLIIAAASAACGLYLFLLGAKGKPSAYWWGVPIIVVVAALFVWGVIQDAEGLEILDKFGT